MGFVLNHALFSGRAMEIKSEMIDGVVWKVMPLGISDLEAIETEVGMSLDDIANLAKDQASPEGRVQNSKIYKALLLLGSKIQIIGWTGIKNEDGEEVEFSQETLQKILDFVPMLALEWVRSARSALAEEGNS